MTENRAEPRYERPPARGLPGLPSLVCLVFGLVLLAAYLAVFGPVHQTAETRSRVARATSDMRTLDVALEAYVANQGTYPPCAQVSPAAGASANPKDPAAGFTTFAAHAGAEAFLAPFASGPQPGAPIDVFSPSRPRTTFGYYTTGQSWVLISAGPDRVYDVPDPSRLPTAPDGDLDMEQFSGLVYDPSNGTDSRGDLFRFGGAVAVRKSVEQVRSDMRVLATALEAYATDKGPEPPEAPAASVSGAYPPCATGADGVNTWAKPGSPAWSLSTFAAVPGHDFSFLSRPRKPHAYIDGIPHDPFSPGGNIRYGYYTTATWWVLQSAGPDGVYDLPDLSKLPTTPEGQPDVDQIRPLVYDPTNGTQSRGDILSMSGRGPL